MALDNPIKNDPFDATSLLKHEPGVSFPPSPPGVTPEVKLMDPVVIGNDPDPDAQDLAAQVGSAAVRAAGDAQLGKDAALAAARPDLVAAGVEPEIIEATQAPAEVQKRRVEAEKEAAAQAKRVAEYRAKKEAERKYMEEQTTLALSTSALRQKQQEEAERLQAEKLANVSEYIAAVRKRADNGTSEVTPAARTVSASLAWQRDMALRDKTFQKPGMRKGAKLNVTQMGTDLSSYRPQISGMVYGATSAPSTNLLGGVSGGATIVPISPQVQKQVDDFARNISIHLQEAQLNGKLNTKEEAEAAIKATPGYTDEAKGYAASIAEKELAKLNPKVYQQLQAEKNLEEIQIRLDMAGKVAQATASKANQTRFVSFLQTVHPDEYGNLTPEKA